MQAWRDPQYNCVGGCRFTVYHTHAIISYAFHDATHVRKDTHDTYSHSGEPGNEANRNQCIQLARTLLVVVTKPYAAGEGCLLIARLQNSLLAALVTVGWSCSCPSTVVSCHEIENQEISCTKGGTDGGWSFIRF